MKKAIVSLSFLVAAVNMSCTDNGEPEFQTSSALITNTGSVLQVRLRRGAPVTNISMTMLKNSTCTLSSADGIVPEPIYSDEHGIVRMSLELPVSANPGTAVDMTLSCLSDDGHQTVRPIQVLGDDNNPSLSAEVNVVDTADPSDVVRAPLTDRAMLLTQAELVAQGYPPRPNPSTAPEAYEHWRDLVSKPARRVMARLMQTSEFADTTTNWSGYVIDKAGADYDLASGFWAVPRVSQTVAGHEVFWVGIDGWTINSIVQDGTSTYAYQILRNGPILTIYGAWIEYYPNPIVGLSNFSVSAGDAISATVWEGDVNGNLNPAGGYGWYSIEDQTNGDFYEGSIAKPAGAPAFSGRSAEWIIERPEIGGGLPPLCDFQSAIMNGIYALSWTDGNSTDHNLSTDANINISMYNGSDLLSTTAEQSATSIDYFWLASL